MMNREIYYQYRTFDMGCGCCSDSLSLYDIYEDGKCISWDNEVDICEDEHDLINALPHLKPFSVHPESKWF